MSVDQDNPRRSRKIILVLGLAVLTLVAGYAYYNTKQFLAEQGEKGKTITAGVVVRELAAIAAELLKKTIERYKGG